MLRKTESDGHEGGEKIKREQWWRGRKTEGDGSGERKKNRENSEVEEEKQRVRGVRGVRERKKNRKGEEENREWDVRERRRYKEIIGCVIDKSRWEEII